MTEQEAIEIINNVNWEDYDSCYCLMKPARDMAIKALEEVQQLRKDMWKLNQICRDYTSLGTVEELKEAKEKQIAKKPVKRSFIATYKGINVCPSCKEPLPSSKEHHCKCGQKLDCGNEDAKV